MPFINALTPIPPVPDGGGWKITPERIWIENIPASQTPAEMYLLQYAAENKRLEQRVLTLETGIKAAIAYFERNPLNFQYEKMADFLEALK